MAPYVTIFSRVASVGARTAILASHLCGVGIEPLPPIYSLDIPDRYQYMDRELIELLKIQVEPLLKDV